MKTFLITSLLGALMLAFTTQAGLNKKWPSPTPLPSFLKEYKTEIKNHFKKPENANILFSFINGDKVGISPHTKDAFRKVNLIFLFSPSGIHLSALMLIISFFIKKIRRKFLRRVIHISFLTSFFFLPHFYAIKRLALLRLLFQLKFITKRKISDEMIFAMTFLISFLLGHYHESPMSFILSFMFISTFFTLRHESKLVLIAGLFVTQTIMAIFMGNKISVLSVPVGLLGSFCVSFIIPLLFIFLGSFWLIKINWAEPLISAMVFIVKKSAILLGGSFTSSSIFMIIAMICLMSRFNGRLRLLALCLFLHTNTAMTPSLFTY